MMWEGSTATAFLTRPKTNITVMSPFKEYRNTDWLVNIRTV
jgi:hypothetical protein